VAPTGREMVSIVIPDGVEDQVSILGEKLTVERQDPGENATYSQPGRPIADITNVMIQYQPPPPKKAPVRRAAPARR
jgi:hypothetical protein